MLKWRHSFLGKYLVALRHCPKVKMKQKRTESQKWLVRCFSIRFVAFWHDWRQETEVRSSSVWWYVWWGEKHWCKGRWHNHEVGWQLLWMHSLFKVLVMSLKMSLLVIIVTNTIWWYGLMDLVMQWRKSWFKTLEERQNCIKLFSKRLSCR